MRCTNTADGAAQNYGLEAALGNLPGVKAVNKFGRATNVDANTKTDIYDRANATDDVDIWVAPTAARTHQVKSTSLNDDNDLPGAGTRTLRIYGLTAWDAAEETEDVAMNGTTNVATTKQWVIIHRMVTLTKGVSANIGTITATADTDSTVTAQINAGEGQAQMAIYGIPSTQTALITGYYASANRATSTFSLDLTLLVNPGPDAQLLSFLVKHTQGLFSGATSYFRHQFSPPFKVAGPAIIKMQAAAAAGQNNVDVSAGFDLLLVDN